MKTHNQEKCLCLRKPSFWKNSVATVTVFGLFSLSTAFAESGVKTGEEDVLVNQYQLLDKDLVTVTFNEGSAVLSDDSFKRHGQIKITQPKESSHAINAS